MERVKGKRDLSHSERPYEQISKDAHYENEYTRWHWGIKPKYITEWSDKSVDAHGVPVFPDAVIECGRLVELKFRVPGTGQDKAFTLSSNESNRSHLVLDPDHSAGRLYIMLPDEVLKGAQKAYWELNPFVPRPMNELARLVGGRHGKLQDYPALMVKPVGLLLSFSYATEKDGEGGSAIYVHRAGEESGIRPLLTVDKKGRLWVVGGNYTSPIPGVTD
jgi:hypothetical protein